MRLHGIVNIKDTILAGGWSNRKKGYIMESTLYEIEFVYKGLPYRRLRRTEKEVDELIKTVTLQGGVVKKIIKW